MSSEPFDYRIAFSRNIGWVTTAEQAALRRKTVAIAGLGGVGGAHLLTLARLGVGSFKIADFDTFDLANFNRQMGASLSTVGQRKTDVLVRMAMDINPELQIDCYQDGVTSSNVEKFLFAADVFVDGLDFFALKARRATFAACHQLGIPAVTVAPLGMGAALLTFLPHGMSFEEYFQLEGQEPEEQLARFLVGLSPALLQRTYLVDDSSVDLAAQRGPSTAMACQLCSGVAATEALKILLGRGPVRSAPWSVHYDAYRQRLVHVWRPWGNANPIQKIALAVARRRLKRTANRAVPSNKA